jgi:multicomponent Na+:H+ antiporter subunit E
MNRLALFILLLLFWIFLTWPAELGPAYLQDLGVGAVAALLVTWITGGSTEGEQTREGGSAIIQRDGRWLQPQRYVWAFVYAFVLAAYVIQANFEVAYRVLHPAMPIRPGIVKIKTRLRRPSSRAALCNSITLTPGTLAVDIRDDGTMMVHWIYVRSLDEDEAAQQIIGRFEWFIERIFE